MPRHALSCRDFIDFIADYLEGVLAPSARSHFEAHLRACPECVAYLDGYRQSAGLPACVFDPEGPPPEDAPRDLVAAILASRHSA